MVAEAPPLRKINGLLDYPFDFYDPLRDMQLLHLKTKSSWTRLVPNKMQRDYLRRKTYRNVIVKARQMGFSTGELADNLLRTLLGGVNYVIAAHDEALAIAMLRQCKAWIVNDLKNHPLFDPGAIYPDTTRELGFPEIKSAIWIETAKGDSPGRGRTVNILHGTETAFWIEGGPIMAGLEASVPMPPDGIITYESTPNGASGSFYEEYRAARRDDPDEMFEPFFYEWWWDETKTLEPPKGFLRTLDAEERELMERHPEITPGQMYFRRVYRKQYARKGKLFLQEYVEDDVTCFITSGKAVFPMEAVRRLTQEIREPRKYEHGDESYTFVSEFGDALQVWKEPVAGERYVAGLDGGEAVGEDASAMVIVDWRSNEHVATLRSNRVRTKLFAQMADKVGRWYNTAFLAVEAREAGYAILETLLHDLHYPNLYYRANVSPSGTIGEVAPGWMTSGKTKPEMVSDFQEVLITGEFITHSQNLVNEIQTYVQEKKAEHWKQAAAKGSHDDELMAAMIAYQVRAFMPRMAGNYERPLRLVS